MKIGKATVPRTAICTSDEHTIVVRGRDLSKELIGKVSFIEHFFLLLVGRLPSAGEAAVLNATLVAIAEHGLVPSVQAARMTFAAAPDAMQGAVAAGVLGCGSVVLGSSETAGRMYTEIDAKVAAGSQRSTSAALEVMQAWRAAGKQIPGYGHPLHKERDERVGALFAVARDAGTDLRFIAIAEAAEALLPEVLGKPLKLNVSGAIPAVLLGAGFPVGGAQGRADPGAHRRPDRPSVRGDPAADRLRPLLPGDPRDGIRRRRACRASRASERPPMSQVLAGIKVVEQGTFITGPAAGMLLGDLGADVVKVEVPVTGDPFRAFQGGLYSPHYQTYNRNKRSIALDTKKPADQAVIDELIAEADVYIQNFRPGVAEKLGVGEKRLRALNPRSSTARSAASARAARRATGRPTTPWRRRRAASSACWSIPRTRASSARRSPIR